MIFRFIFAGVFARSNEIFNLKTLERYKRESF